MKHPVPLITALLLPSATVANGQLLEIADLETRVVAKDEGRWFGRVTVERTGDGTLVLCYRSAS
jgi:hypothetical protein